jgi:ABC-type multidrug transport system fused ATPase/permease subunit
MNTVAEESFSNIRTVKAFSNEDREIEKFTIGNMIVYEAGKKKALYQAFFSFLTQILLYGAMAGVIYVSSLLYEDGKISIGEISSFMFYMLMLVFNFAMVAMVFGNVAAVVGASDKVYELMEHIPDINSSGGAEIDGVIDGTLEIRDVKFKYPSKQDV